MSAAYWRRLWARAEITPPEVRAQRRKDSSRQALSAGWYEMYETSLVFDKGVFKFTNNINVQWELLFIPILTSVKPIVHFQNSIVFHFSEQSSEAASGVSSNLFRHP